jgi:hypothetical protein
MLSPELALLYEVEHRALVQAVTRNRTRFPGDFAFKLTPEETRLLRSQSVILDAAGPGSGRGRYSKYPPYAFTEQGVAMLSSVLRSRRAAEVNVEIMRAFVHLRQWVIGHRDLARKIAELEKRYDGQFKVVFEALQELMEPPPMPPRKQIGFRRTP